MATITAALRNNISQLLNKPVASNKSAKSSQSEFISSVDNIGIQNAAQEFIKLPCQTSRSDKLFDEMALYGLPDVLSETHPDWKGEAIRNMLGIIYKDAQPEDIPKFEKVFREFAKADSKFTKDAKVTSELSFLFQKYGETALRRHVDEFTQHCRNAWEYHHTTNNELITDEDIFTPDVMACYEILNTQIKELSKPDQTWATIICGGTYFKDTCSALSKVLKHHDAAQVNQSPDESPLRNIPQNHSSLPPGLQQPDVSHPGITIPAGNGHGPITINNTANGGNGTSTVNGNVPERTPASDIDFGIALLNTPDEQLGNEKARLVEKFMDLYWGRAQNGGQDKFSDHVDSVVQSNPPQTSLTETLSSPQIFHAAEELVSMPAPQFSSVIDSLPQPVMGEVETIAVAQKMAQLEENTKLLPAEQSVPLVPVDSGRNLQHAATQVAQALSALLTETDTSVNSQHSPQNRLSGVTTLVSSEPEQGLQPTVTGKSNLTNGVERTNNAVQQLVRKFETLNNHYLARNEGVAHRMSLGLTDRINATSLSRAENANRTELRSHKRTPDKFNVSVNQTPLYTTNRTIDPFSRHSVDVKHLANSFNQKPEEEPDNPDLSSDMVNSL